MRVLVVEDETILANAVAEMLRRESFAVDVVHDGQAALERLSVNDYDVIVLDRDLPTVHGDEVCQAVVASDSLARVLMLTAASAVHARVEGLAIGADDYLIKPFALVELAARVHALGRRSGAPTGPILERGDIQLDTHARTVTRGARPVDLGVREFAVLSELLRAQGGVVSAEHLLEKAWDENIDPFSNTVRVAVMRLRKKLGDPQTIETIPGVGYRIR